MIFERILTSGSNEWKTNIFKLWPNTEFIQYHFFFILLIMYLPEILVTDILEEKSSFPNLVLLGPSRSYVTGIYLKPQGIMGRIQLE